MTWLLLLSCAEPAPSDSVTDTADTDSAAPEPTLRVFLLAGQSNADGEAPAAALPAVLQAPQPDVRLYWHEDPIWTDLHPASSIAPDLFGPEVTFGRTCIDVDPHTPTAIIKHAVPSTDLWEYWSVRGEGYATLLDTTRDAVAALDAEGTSYELAGLLWMQGEADANSETKALAYKAGLTSLITSVRGDLETPDLLVVVGKINAPDHPYRDIVRAAENAVARDVPNVVTVETDDLSLLEDRIHYDADAMQLLGARFAVAARSKDE